MQLSHRFTVPARVDDVWAAFNRLERVAPCFPGGSLEQVSGDDFTGSVKIKFGPILLLYKGSGRFVERLPAERRLVLEAKGRDRRGQGSATVGLTAEFAALDRGTEVRVDTDLTLTGRPAQFGQALVSDVVDRVLDRFVRCVADGLTSRMAEESGGAPATIEPTQPETVEEAGLDLATAPLSPTAEQALVEEPDDEPVIDPRGDDADFADPVPPGPHLPSAPPVSAPPVSVVREEGPITEAPPAAPAPTELDEPVALTRMPAATASSRPGELPLERQLGEPTGLRRYAPAVAAAVVGVTGVVVWALRRRQR